MATPFYECPKLDPLCREIPLERHDCKYALTYSICKANIEFLVNGLVSLDNSV